MNPIVNAVKEMIDKQQEKGMQKYGVPIHIDSYTLKGWIEHAQQEIIDQLIYLECIKQSIDVRPEVMWFARQMEKKLRENDHKPHWSKMSMDYLIHRLYQEADELWQAIKSGDVNEIIKESADVSNFSMMIADNAGCKYGESGIKERNAQGKEDKNAQRFQEGNGHTACTGI